jgi:acid phosphatase (class A)
MFRRISIGRVFPSKNLLFFREKTVAEGNIFDILPRLKFGSDASLIFSRQIEAHMSTRISIALILSLLAAPAIAREPIFVTPDQSEAALILPDPPAEGSQVQKDELAHLHEIEKARTPEQAEAARADALDETIFLYKNVFGDIFTEQGLPLTAALGKRIVNDAGPNAGAAKQSFHRMRPYMADKTLAPACPIKPAEDSYPSGHTTVGWMLGLTLVEMVPEKREEILSRAQDYAHNRMVCGVHYPSDLQGGRALAYAVHAVMTQNPQYRQELAAARAELRKALNLSPAEAQADVK